MERKEWFFQELYFTFSPMSALPSNSYRLPLPSEVDSEGRGKEMTQEEESELSSQEGPDKQKEVEQRRKL